MSKQFDPAWFGHARERMVREQLIDRGVTSPQVCDAMRRVPRERFVPPELAAQAYDDCALRIARGQTISQPYMVGLMTAELELGPHDRVLEIGSGSGYQTAVLAMLSRVVFTIEWRLPLMVAAAEAVRALGLRNVTFRCGDGSTGWPQQAPFDAIIVTAGAPAAPGALAKQLAAGGRLVAPVGPLADQVLVQLRRTASGIEQRELLKCRFVKLLGREGWDE